MGMDLKDEDYIEHLFVASTHDYLLFFTTVGKVYRLKVHELPLGSRQSKGRAIVNLLPFRQDEQVRAVIATRDFKEAKYLVFATKDGVVKKTEFLEYNTPLKADGIIAIKMREGDELVGVRHSDGDDDVLMVSRGGQAIRFHESDVRPMGRAASGVQGMRLRAGDEVIEIDIAQDDADLLVVTENGYGKRTRVAEYPVKGRGGLGVKTVQLTEAQGQARRRPRRPRRLPGDADLDRRHRDPDAGRGHQAARPLDAGRDRDAPARRRASRSRASRPWWRGRTPTLPSTTLPTRLWKRASSRSRSRTSTKTGSPPRRTPTRSANLTFPASFSSQNLGKACICCPEGPSLYVDRRISMAYNTQVDLLEPINLCGASRQGRALPGPGLPDRRHLEDAARLLDEQGADPDEGQEAADLRHRGARDRHADQAGQGQGPEPRRGDRGRPPVPRAPTASSLG